MFAKYVSLVEIIYAQIRTGRGTKLSYVSMHSSMRYRRGFYRWVFPYLVLFDDGTVELYWQVTAAGPLQLCCKKMRPFGLLANNVFSSPQMLSNLVATQTLGEYSIYHTAYIIQHISGVTDHPKVSPEPFYVT